MPDPADRETRIGWRASDPLLDYGHLGAGDEIVGLNQLLRSGRCAPDDLILAIGAGIGYCRTAAILQVLGDPVS